MFVVQLNHHDGSVTEVNVSLDARLCDLSISFCVESVEIVQVLL
jgi:hypothetical protein